MTATDIAKDTSIVTGNSIDHVTLDHCSFGRSFTLATHGGVDVLTNDASHFRGASNLYPGDDDDQVIGFDDA